MKSFKIFVPVFLTLCVVFTVLAPTVHTAENISGKILRLHILANSDSAEDQNIKLMLKEFFLENTTELFAGKTLDENIKIASDNKAELEDMCNKFLVENGSAHKARVTVEEEFFSTRVYDDFTLPAGVYNSVKIEIGQGDGHNWWCIVFPSVCLYSCSETMQDYLSEDEMQLVDGGYTPKFKIIEIYEKIKYRMEKK